MPIITLLTDFGSADGYVGEIKGLLLSEVPGVTIVDIAHDVAAHDVESGRLALARYWRRYPAGTVHIAIVDPGVGSARLALAISSDGKFLVGPDNGLLSPALLMKDVRTVALAVPPNAAPTFHGRDVFAPAAARLARGLSIDTLGTAVADPVIRRTPEPRREPSGELVGEVLVIDRFGNAITNLPHARGSRVSVGDREFDLHRTYADLAPGTAGAVVGSSGFVEIVVRDGRACDSLGIARGAPVRLR